MKNKTPRHIEVRKCINCGREWEVKVKSETSPNRRQLFCTECISSLSNWERQRIIMSKIPSARKKYLEGKRVEFLRNYKKQILHRTEIRARVKGLEFNINESDIVIPETCPILEVPIVVGTKGDYEYSPSIDRIDNSKGYIKGNVQIISKKANSMKNSATPTELITFCKNILRYSLNNTEKESIELQDKEPVR
jgi:hypothetical protein